MLISRKIPGGPSLLFSPFFPRQSLRFIEKDKILSSYFKGERVVLPFLLFIERQVWIAIKSSSLSHSRSQSFAMVLEIFHRLPIMLKGLLLGGLPSILLLFFVKGYRNYLSVGPGGFGQSPLGYIRCFFIKYLLKFHRVDYSDRKIFEIEGRRDSRKWLREEDVEERLGFRPEICD